MPKHNQTITLYSIVFHSTLVKGAVFVLLVGMLLQPISLAYAAEQEIDDGPVEIAEETTETASAEPVVEDEPLVLLDEPSDVVSETTTEEVESSAPSQDEPPPVPTTETSLVDVPESIEDTGATSTDDGPVDDDGIPPENPIATSTDDSATTTSSDNTGVPGVRATSTGTSTNNVAIESNSSSTATTTTVVESGSGSTTDSDPTPETETDENTSAGDESTQGDTADVFDIDTEVVTSGTSTVAGVSTSTATSTVEELEYPIYTTTINEDNFYQFSRAECVAVGDGSYYCGANEPAPAPEADSFFAAPDKDGDLEIYAKIDGEQTQLTFNTLEDAAPYYDAISDSLVWHRLINDRYQIVSYNFDTEKETVLTNDFVNNMEPTRYGDITVWQRWIGDDWEIILHDGDRTEVLTTNVYQDIAPSIRGEYVIWKTLYEGEQRASVYNIKTKEIIEIQDGEVGSAMTNPRMVWVYDAVNETGDITTHGFDPQTGKIIPLDAVPAQLPDSLPSSDQTGETRALIQTKTNYSGREVTESDDDLASTTPEISFMPPATSTPATTTDIVIPPVETEVSSSTESTEIEDLVIPPLESEIATTTERHIGVPDVVIPNASSSNSI